MDGTKVFLGDDRRGSTTAIRLRRQSNWGSGCRTITGPCDRCPRDRCGEERGRTPDNRAVSSPCPSPSSSPSLLRYC